MYGAKTPSVALALLWRDEQGFAHCSPLLAFALGSSSSLAFRSSFAFRDGFLGARIRVWDNAEKAAEERSGNWKSEAPVTCDSAHKTSLLYSANSNAHRGFVERAAE